MTTVGPSMLDGVEWWVTNKEKQQKYMFWCACQEGCLEYWSHKKG